MDYSPHATIPPSSRKEKVEENAAGTPMMKG